MDRDFQNILDLLVEKEMVTLLNSLAWRRSVIGNVNDICEVNRVLFLALPSCVPYTEAVFVCQLCLNEAGKTN